ncbi:uncharacterized protein VTP21DRAFT_4411, partial [Calcarisporiella thermophila]|uniref:uncharacterized protein n=1 Tax=Calcarisporiella thermophila TaxID=911321 RepID=UPI0037443474
EDNGGGKGGDNGGGKGGDNGGGKGGDNGGGKGGDNGGGKGGDNGGVVKPPVPPGKEGEKKEPPKGGEKDPLPINPETTTTIVITPTLKPTTTITPTTTTIIPSPTTKTTQSPISYTSLSGISTTPFEFSSTIQNFASSLGTPVPTAGLEGATTKDSTDNSRSLVIGGAVAGSVIGIIAVAFVATKFIRRRRRGSPDDWIATNAGNVDPFTSTLNQYHRH